MRQRSRDTFLLTAIGVLVMASHAPLGATETPAAPDAATTTPFVGTVTGTKVNVRAGSNRNFEIIHQLTKGESVVIIGQQGEWYAIELPPEASAFIAAQFVARDSASAGHVTGARVNVRGGPGTKYNTLGKVAAGEPLAIRGEQDGWLQILPPSSARGWVAKSLIQPDPANTPAAVHAAYDARRASLLASSGATLPPTGSGIMPGTRTAALPLMQGRLEPARSVWPWKKPAAYQLVHAHHTIAYVTSATLDLNEQLHQDVAVWGQITDPSSKIPLITVTAIAAAAPPATTPSPAQ